MRDAALDTLEALPKAELHCHLDGIICREIAEAIQSEGTPFPISARDFESISKVTDHASFFEWWKVCDKLSPDLNSFRPVLKQHIRRLRQDNVVYAELMVSAGKIPADAGEALEAWTAFREWLDDETRDGPTIVLLASFSKSKSSQEFEQFAGRLLPLHQAGLAAGMALAGPEHGQVVQRFGKTLARLQAAGVGVEIHAGEWEDLASVREVLLQAKPDRLGHGIALFASAELLDYVREHGVHLEMCPTSNLKTGSVACAAEHPIKSAIDAGLSVSVNTDNPGTFESSMGSEYRMLSQSCGLTIADFQRVFECTMAARFGRGGGREVPPAARRGGRRA